MYWAVFESGNGWQAQTVSSPPITQIHTPLSEQTRQLFHVLTLNPSMLLLQNGER